MAAAEFNFGPEGQVVAVIVRVVQEAAMFGDQAACIGTVAAGVPAERTGAAQTFQCGDAQADVLGFQFRRQSLVVDPAPAVAGDLMAQFDTGVGYLRIALKCHADVEQGQWQLPPFELAQDAPYPGSRAVFVDGSMLMWRAG